MVNDTAQGFYEGCGRLEWNRPPESAYSQVEHTIIVHYLDKYLPPKGLILDAGGGNGRYTIELAKKGYQVVLLDRSAAQLAIAKEEVAKLPKEVRENVVDIVQGSIEDLSEFESGHFDAVICVRGALSRLIECDSRENAAEELARVARPVGPVFATVLSFYGALRKVLSEYPEDMHLLPEFLESRQKPTSTAYHDCFFFTPEEMVDLLARKGIEVVEYVGVQGLSAHLKDVTEECSRTPERWEIWKNVLLKTCNHPSVVGVSDHILVVGFA